MITVFSRESTVPHHLPGGGASATLPDMRTLPILLLCLLLAPAALANGWEEIADEDGVVVTQKEVRGRDLPTFRGVTTIDASIYEVLAVLNDNRRRKDWLHKCEESRLVKRINEFETIIYNRTDAPWPVSDRDMVLHTRIWLVEPGTEVLATFKGIKHVSVEEVDDAVRMPFIEGHYRLRKVTDDRTWVEYQVNADPGGSLPKWLARRASKELPLETLRNLKKQIRKTRGLYEAFLNKWDPARLPPGTEPPAPPLWSGP